MPPRQDPPAPRSRRELREAEQRRAAAEAERRRVADEANERSRGDARTDRDHSDPSGAGADRRRPQSGSAAGERTTSSTDAHGRDAYGRDAYGGDAYGRGPYGGGAYGGDAYGRDPYGRDPNGPGPRDRSAAPRHDPEAYVPEPRDEVVPDERWSRSDRRDPRDPRPDGAERRPEPDLLNPWDDDPAPRSARADRRSAAALDLDEHEVEERRRGRGALGCLVALLVLAGLVVAAWFFLQGPINAVMDRFQPPEDYSGAGTGEVVFMINEGDGGETIAANLQEQDIVASAEAFIDEMRSRDEAPTFYPGAYGLANQMSAEAALDALLDPATKMENTFVIQEGLWARDALAAASAATGIPLEELQAAAADPQALGLPAEATSVEGFLFPATYTFGPDVTADEVIRTLVDRTFQSLDAAGVPPEDRWETIIIASLIERESGSEADSYKVSRVIQNRLDPAQFDSGLLQFDSTVHYGTGDDTLVTTTDAERADASNPYNTYVHPGLPPGPIGNPGDVAIDAARNPADGPWLYFVTVNLETGETVFSATFAEHEQAVQRFYQYLEENQ
ncbi:endolytic transglycosylase MltG [Agromyces sp. ZXT2-6]|uniref:endolytic transglycosylase MltG n=1 Tax=Agromyces sp. ZXT2-6 TaxID=3461153 RepID=UPI0040552EEE